MNDDARSNIRTQMEEAYLLGFKASGEGYNGEYPFEHDGEDPETDRFWTEQRDTALNLLLENDK